jgi:hypothetical protein
MKIIIRNLFLTLIILVTINLSNLKSYAAELDPETGKLNASSSATLYGFEDEQSPLEVVLINAEGAGLSSNIFQTSIVYDEMGIEGNKALKFSASWLEARIKLSSLGNSLNGKRIEIRLWTLPKGIKINAQLLWEANGNLFSAIHFNPTGRVTDDGWRELSSGPLDYNLAGNIALSTLKLVNDQLEFPLSGQTVGLAHHNLIDAIEIFDLGAAAVAASMCRAPTEKEQCGEQGSCFIGRCVDSAFLWGAMPNASIASQAIDHKVYQVEIAEGVRKSRHNFDAFKQSMEALKQSQDGQAFWQGHQDSLQMLEDGHLITPKAARPNIPNAGFCINAGEADLLPSAQQPVLPMVFNQTSLVNGVILKAGDIITSIDGIEPHQWVEKVRSPYFIAPGDVESRLVMQYHNLSHLIAQSGALVEFKRCEIESGCSVEQVEVFNVDFAELVGEPYWKAELSPWMFENGFCDFRFDEGEPLRISDVEFSKQVISNKSNAMTEIQFNGFHHPASNPVWHASFEGALADSPTNILIDHRFGFGGSPTGLHYILDNFIGPDDYKKTATMSWHGTLDEETHVQSALDCNQLLTSQYECGWVWSYKQGSYVVDTATQDSKLALVYGWGVSASDFLMRILQERSAETRVFGISTLPGGYGTTNHLPNLLNEFEPGRLQVQDGMFEFKQWSEFESGIGAIPDQFVYQKQSDAIKGIDSIILAAETWLQTSSNGE